MQQTIIVVTGLPGSGKTTFARMLSKEIGMTVFTTDVVRRELFPEKRTYSNQETRTTVSEVHSRIEQMLDKGESVIVDAVFADQKARQKYQEYANQYKTRLFFIQVVVSDEALAKDRITQSLADPDNPSEATYVVRLAFKERFEQIDGDYILIENSGTLEELEARAKEVAAEIKA